MLGNTLVLPLSTGNVTLVKINQDSYSSEYLFRDSTHSVRARIRHSKVAATALKPTYDRHNFEVLEVVFTAGAVAEYERKFYFVHEHLPGDTSVVLADGIADLAIATSNAFLVSLLGWES
jgi:hypothetical protein